VLDGSDENLATQVGRGKMQPAGAGVQPLGETVAAFASTWPQREDKTAANNSGRLFLAPAPETSAVITAKPKATQSRKCGRSWGGNTLAHSPGQQALHFRQPRKATSWVRHRTDVLDFDATLPQATRIVVGKPHPARQSWLLGMIIIFKIP